MSERKNDPFESSDDRTSPWPRRSDGDSVTEDSSADDDSRIERRGKSRGPAPTAHAPPPVASMDEVARLTAECVQSEPQALPSLLALLATCRETAEALRSHRPRAVDISRIAEMGELGRALVDFWMWRDLMRRARVGARSGLFPSGMGDEASRS